MGYPKKHRGRRKMGSKKRRARKKNKIFTAIDNTWGTPYFLKPIKLGFDMSIVSATKYYC